MNGSKDYFKQVISNIDITNEDYQTMSLQERLELISRIRLLCKCRSDYTMTVASLRFLFDPFRFSNVSHEVSVEYWKKDTPQMYHEAGNFRDISRELRNLRGSILEDPMLATYDNACKFNDLTRRYNYIITTLSSKERELLSDYDNTLKELI